MQSGCNRSAAVHSIAPETEGADQRQGDLESMSTNLDLWSFGAKQAVLTWVDYFNQDDPPNARQLRRAAAVDQIGIPLARVGTSG
jgi:hypothetical protein